MNSSRVSIKFKSSTYTVIIANPVATFLIKMHQQIELFTYPSLRKFWLKRLYHIRPDYFNPYKNRCNLIEYMFHGFEFITSGNLNPSKIFIYIYIYIYIYISINRSI